MPRCDGDPQTRQSLGPLCDAATQPLQLYGACRGLPQFGRIQRTSSNRSFDECVALVGDFLDSQRKTDDAPQTARERSAPVD